VANISAVNASGSSDLLIQSAITIAIIFVALILGDLIQPWGTKVSLSILEVGAVTPTVFAISGIWLVLGAVHVLPSFWLASIASCLYWLSFCRPLCLWLATKSL